MLLSMVVETFLQIVTAIVEPKRLFTGDIEQANYIQ